MYYKLLFVLMLLLQILALSETLQFNIHPDRDLSTAEILAKYGYPLELHEIVTDDGYILLMQRIPRGKDNNSSGSNNRHPVIMIHGTCGCADNFIVPGPGKATPYYLADRGFDIWMLNTRGSRHSRRHRTLDPDKDKKFWDFGWHEVAVIDIPMAIDYILKLTNNSKLFYIGHSQGATAYFAFASEMQEYNNKIHVAVNMAPSCLLGDIRNVIRLMSKHSSLIQTVAEMLNIYEIFPSGYTTLINIVAKTLCAETTFFIDICYAFIYFGDAYGDMDETTPQLVFSKSPAHCSVKQVLHYLQIIYSGIFRQYDYGDDGNLKLYGSKLPPAYSFSNMTAPIALFYAPADNICHQKGVKRLAKILPNAVSYPIHSEIFNHVDFIFGRRIVKFVNKPVYQLFKKYL